jgi:hypothetical protein
VLVVGGVVLVGGWFDVTWLILPGVDGDNVVVDDALDEGD